MMRKLTRSYKGKAADALGRKRHVHRCVSAGVVDWHAWKMREVVTLI